MWAAIFGVFPTLIGWIGNIFGYFQAKQVAQDQAASAEIADEKLHQADGSQSVIDRESDSEQNAALDNLAKSLDNPEIKKP